MSIHRRACLAVAILAALLAFAPLHAASYRLISSPQTVAGSEALEKGDYGQAIQALESSLADRNGDPAGLIHTNLCVAYTAMHAFEKALPECEKAVAENCANSGVHAFNGSLLDAISHNNRGVMRARLGDYTGAMEDFELASRPIVDRNNVRRKFSPYGHEIRANVRLAISSQLDPGQSRTVQIADID